MDENNFEVEDQNNQNNNDDDGEDVSFEELLHLLSSIDELLTESLNFATSLEEAYSQVETLQYGLLVRSVFDSSSEGKKDENEQIANDSKEIRNESNKEDQTENNEAQEKM